MYKIRKRCRCERCDREIYDEESKLLGFGPECWKNVRPHCTACGQPIRITIKEDDVGVHVSVDVWMGVGLPEYGRIGLARWYSGCCHAKCTNPEVIDKLSFPHRIYDLERMEY